MEGRFIAYYRVSTQGQRRSALGLDAQKEDVERYLNGGRWDLLQTFVEVESGKRDDNRPQLQAALEACKRTGATLVIAKLDRLSRDLAFVATLTKSGARFVACDMPNAGEFEINIRASLAQEERRLISERTRAALQAAKARGTKLGNPNGLTREAIRAGHEAGLAVRSEKADEFARRVLPQVRALREQVRATTLFDGG